MTFRSHATARRSMTGIEPYGELSIRFVSGSASFLGADTHRLFKKYPMDGCAAPIPRSSHTSDQVAPSLLRRRANAFLLSFRRQPSIDLREAAVRLIELPKSIPIFGAALRLRKQVGGYSPKAVGGGAMLSRPPHALKQRIGQVVPEVANRHIGRCQFYYPEAMFDCIPHGRCVRRCRQYRDARGRASRNRSRWQPHTAATCCGSAVTRPVSGRMARISGLPIACLPGRSGSRQ